MTCRSNLTFNADGIFKCEVDTCKGKADKVTVKGVTINSGALFSFVGIGNQMLDGSSFTAYGNNFQASYGGGNGNDLTLTVVP
ncbi:MAG: hypothetical protein H0X34_04360 [Chthoniobacterales bacterium]|nr:hypothetical protein [Chthoniobacterales bacterium]